MTGTPCAPVDDHHPRHAKMHAHILQTPTTSTLRLLLPGSRTGVHELRVVVYDPLDQTLLFEMSNGSSSERAVDFHSVDEGRLGDNSVSGDFFDDSVTACEHKVREGKET